MVSKVCTLSQGQNSRRRFITSSSTAILREGSISRFVMAHWSGAGRARQGSGAGLSELSKDLFQEREFFGRKRHLRRRDRIGEGILDHVSHAKGHFRATGRGGLAVHPP